MDPKKKKRLEDAGWKFGSVQEFLELSDEDMTLVESKREETDEESPQP